jgi:RNA polymerase sigma-70 factor (ECF subfamily)
MPTLTSGLEDSGIPSLTVAEAQASGAGASPERRQEFESILPHALPRFRRIAMRWLRNSEDAEDAVQDAMFSAFRHIGSFDGRSRMMTWLTAILINAIRMQIRRRPRARVQSLDQNPEADQRALSEFLADPKPTPEQTLERRELYGLLYTLTGGLPRSQQAALRLRLRDDFSIREAARTLGVPEGTLKAQLARGRAALTEKFHSATGTTRAAASGSGSRVRRKRPPFRPQGHRDQGLTQLPIQIFSEQGFSQQEGCEVRVDA